MQETVSPAFHILKSLVFETGIPYWSMEIAPFDLFALVEECDDTHIGDRLADLAETVLAIHDHIDFDTLVLTWDRVKLTVDVRMKEPEDVE